MTQGMITILENNKVKYKIVTGTDGGCIEDIPLEELQDKTPEELYEIALKYECGGEESLVVSFINEDNEVEHYHRTDHMCHEITPWYWDQFFNPTFNPRWAKGTVQYYREIEDDRNYAFIVFDKNNKLIKVGDTVKVVSPRATEYVSKGTVLEDEVAYHNNRYYIKGYASVIEIYDYTDIEIMEKEK